MAAMAPAIPYVMTALSAASTISQIQNQRQAASQAASQAADAQAQQAQLLANEQARRDAQSRDLLAEQTASRRAAMGAMGIGSSGGSGDAIIQGLAAKTDEAIAADDQSLAARLAMQQPRKSLIDDTQSGLQMAQTGLKVFQSFYGAMS
jgi:hypothetical protein